MATAVQPTEPLSEAESATGRTLAISLLWGGIMLFVLGWWLGTKHEDLARPIIWLIWLMALASFAGGFLHWFTLLRPGETPQHKLATIGRQRKLLSVALVAGGLILVVLGGYLAFNYKSAAFGETVGMGLVGVVAVISGRNLLLGVRPASEHPVFDWLRRQRAGLGIVMVGVGLLLVLTALGLVMLAKLGQAWFPEMAGILLLGLIVAGGGVWLTLSQSEQLTTTNMRVFVLVMGGMTGLVLALAAAGRAFLWQDEVFGGMRAWQGDRSWHLWVCAYVELLGLALMFGSLLLARSDIRSNVTLRRVLYGYNAVLTGLLLLALLVVANIVLFALFSRSYYWSQSRGAHTLSVSTKNLLTNLRQPTTFYVFLPRSSLDAELRNFLDNCQDQSPKIAVKFVNPDQDFAEYDDLAKRFPDSLTSRKGRFEKADRGILVVYGELPADPTKKTPHAFIPFSRMAEEIPARSKEGDTKVTIVYKGEAEIMRELGFLAEDRKNRKLYFLQGDGELAINVMEPFIRRNLTQELEGLGCGQVVEALKKDKFEVQGLSFGEELAKDKTPNVVYAKASGADKRKSIPDDAEAVIIAGPGVPLDPQTISAMERYMDRGGKLLVYLDIVLNKDATKMIETGLGDFLKKYGVQVGKDYALRVSLQDPRTVFATVPVDTSNDLARAFLDEPFVMRSVRIVRPDTGAQKYKPEVLLQLDRRQVQLKSYYLEESSVRNLENAAAYIKSLDEQGVLVAHISAEPLPVAVGVSEKLFNPASGKETLKPRLIVFGDAECISNGDVVRNPLAYAWLASGLEWMSEKKGLIGPRPKEANSYTINPQKVDVPRLAYLPGWLMMLSIMSLGAGIWVIRRR